jgi:signal transduction histidine kinase
LFTNYKAQIAGACLGVPFYTTATRLPHLSLMAAVALLWERNESAEPAFPSCRSFHREQITMRLASFIRENQKPIIEHWEQFARTLIPASDSMSPLNLRNHIKEILLFITDDIETSQTEPEQIEKSQGKKLRSSEQSAAEIHASLRQAGGFNMNQMVSEFRALRASVIRLWDKQLTEVTKDNIWDLIRFNESIDQIITEAISYYTRKIDHSRDIFLGILSHDLRNPLGAMLMSAQLILHIGTLNERQTMLVSQILASAGRATEILNRLLDLTRARLGSGLKIIKGPMDMAFVSRQLVEEMRAMHPDRTFDLKISGETEGDWDRPRIGQVFSNLLGNAVQYGFKDLPIGIMIKGEPEEVLVSVHNDGVPIPPNAMRGIFDSLTRGEGVKGDNHSGSMNLGLGLYITKEIVSAHGGTVGVTSSEKDGTTFTARFPR